MNLSINVQLGEVLSRKDCADIVKHIIKFIVYNNQQIPYTYDGFQRIIARKKHLDERVSFLVGNFWFIIMINQIHIALGKKID